MALEDPGSPMWRPPERKRSTDGKQREVLGCDTAYVQVSQILSQNHIWEGTEALEKMRCQGYLE